MADVLFCRSPGDDLTELDLDEGRVRVFKSQGIGEGIVGYRGRGVQSMFLALKTY